VSVVLLGAGFAGSYGTQGTVARVQSTGRPTVQAAFPRQSYKPGETARLVLFGRAPQFTVQVFHAGTERSRIAPRDLMLGSAVSTPMRVPGSARSVSIRIGAWPSGLYFARINASGDRVGYAPFVLRPTQLGVHGVAIVLPTLTWQAYNFRDDDADGDADSWYAQGTTARLGRPFENRGVPPHYKHYDQPFLRWLVSTNRNVDYLAQSDLETATGSALASSYSAIVFPGHHEYVTQREYDVVEAYRNRGGNLMFLSANNFFYKVVTNGGLMRRVGKWRDLGRPEAALVGVQYIGNDDGEHRGPWIVRPAGAGHWIFAGTGARPGTSFSNAGIEIDRTAPSSPRSTKVLAEIPNLLGPGMTAQMTFYETDSGAKVFAAGAFSLAGSIRQPRVARLISNLWDRLGNRTVQARGRVLATARGYGWPVKPFDRQHPVRGFFGDPRIGGAHGDSKQFHFGVDVSAPNGTPVFATITGTVSFIHADALSISAGGGLAFEYWHIVPTVRAGERVRAYETVIGHVEKPWAHVHFSERRNGVYVNPLRAGAMRPFVDEAAPRVRAIHLRGAELTADVEDETPIAVPAPWASLPVMPAVVRWRVAGGSWETVVDFRSTIPSASAFHVVYARATRQNHANLPGLYRVRLATGALAASVRGRVVEVQLIDAGGNRVTGSSTIAVR
jgi:murein DD-endopeptidase MepM/ murein hydrolase activator NlpD